jgi:hypothetical protein
MVASLPIREGAVMDKKRFHVWVGKKRYIAWDKDRDTVLERVYRKVGKRPTKVYEQPNPLKDVR